MSWTRADMSEDDDGGMQWAAETQREREEHWGERDARMLKEHREWVKKFNEAKEPSNAEHQ